MNLRCPACGAQASLEHWHDPDVCAFLDVIKTLGNPILEAAPQYLALFRPLKNALTWKKAFKVLVELAEEVKGNRVQVKGKPSRPCPPQVWALAMQQMVDNPTIERPLKNHNYLKQVAWSLADNEDKRREARPAKNKTANKSDDLVRDPAAANRLKKITEEIG